MYEEANFHLYSHSPIHTFLLHNDITSLTSLLTSLPKLSPPHLIETASDSKHQLQLSQQISSILDLRSKIPNQETPLHLAVRLNSLPSLRLLLLAGADPCLRNAQGWTPLQVSVVLRRPKNLSLLLRRHIHLSIYANFRRTLPLVPNILAAIPDFYLEVGFRFESDVIPFLSRIAPSDTYKVWKRGPNLRVDTTLCGFDGLRVKRSDKSFLFSGSAKKLYVLNRGKKKVRDVLEGWLHRLERLAKDENGGKGLAEDGKATRPGLDITRAELVKVKNWRGKDRVEMVGEWKAKVYDIKNVVFSLTTMVAAKEEEEEEVEEEEEFVDAEEEHIGIAEEEKEEMTWEKAAAEAERGGKNNEKEVLRNLRPTVWLTEDFPLKTEELIAMLDVLGNKVKAMRRLRDLLTTKFPPGNFPVKVSIPVVPTVRVIITFSKYVNLQSSEKFVTPLSSPGYLAVSEDVEHQKAEAGVHKSSWLKWGNNLAVKPSSARSKSTNPSQVFNHVDPFAIPSDYTWVRIKDKRK